MPLPIHNTPYTMHHPQTLRGIGFVADSPLDVVRWHQHHLLPDDVWLEGPIGGVEDEDKPWAMLARERRCDVGKLLSDPPRFWAVDVGAAGATEGVYVGSALEVAEAVGCDASMCELLSGYAGGVGVGVGAEGKWRPGVDGSV